jgi:hypothetical protein
MMGIQKPVIFTAGPEISRFPENACLRLEVGPVEDEHLAGLIRWVASDRSALAEIGSRARSHILAEHDAERVAMRFWEVVRQISGEG